MSSDIEHWQINATVFKDRVEEIHYVSDPLRNVRRRPQTKIWQVERFLGRGGFGEVRLERNSDGQARAVKRIPTTSTALSNSECVKELKALLEFSKPKASRKSYPSDLPHTDGLWDSLEKQPYLSTFSDGLKMDQICSSLWNMFSLVTWRRMCPEIQGESPW
jgi:hypothetical protein